MNLSSARHQLAMIKHQDLWLSGFLNSFFNILKILRLKFGQNRWKITVYRDISLENPTNGTLFCVLCLFGCYMTKIVSFMLCMRSKFSFLGSFRPFLTLFEHLLGPKTHFLVKYKRFWMPNYLKRLILRVLGLDSVLWHQKRSVSCFRNDQNT